MISEMLLFCQLLPLFINQCFSLWNWSVTTYPNCPSCQGFPCLLWLCTLWCFSTDTCTFCFPNFFFLMTPSLFMLSSPWQFYLFQCCQLSTTFGRYIFCTVPFISSISTVYAVHVPVRSQYCLHPHLKNHLGLRQRKGSNLTMPLINLTCIYWV